MFIRILSFITLFSVLLFALTHSVSANEGEVELRSTISSQPHRCFVFSMANVNNQFALLMTCRDLSFTPTSVATRYVAWASVTDADEPLKLGLLDFGRAQFVAPKPFSSLFVTIETNPGVKEPEGQVVMRGNLEPNEFLDPTRPTPTLSEDDSELKEIEITPTPTPERSLSNTLRRSGVVVSIILLGLLIGFIFVITRPRR